MSPHHSDQISQRSQVSRVALCMSKIKVLWVSQSVSERQGHLLSCFGQLKTTPYNAPDSTDLVPKAQCQNMEQSEPFKLPVTYVLRPNLPYQDSRDDWELTQKWRLAGSEDTPNLRSSSPWSPYKLSLSAYDWMIFQKREEFCILVLPGFGIAKWQKSAPTLFSFLDAVTGSKAK